MDPRDEFSTRSAFGAHANAPAALLARTDRARLLDLTLSNPTTAELPYADEAIEEALCRGIERRYRPDALGERESRRAIARELQAGGASTTEDRVLLTSHTSESYGYLFKLLCDPGDNVLVPQPSYPLLELLTRLEGVEMRSYRLLYDGRWHIDLDNVRRQMDARTKAIVTVHPNNPTGSFVKRDELSSLQQLGLPLISDEVFAEYAIAVDEDAVPSLSSCNDGLVFVLGGLSKSACLPQLKLGWTSVSGEARRVAQAMERLAMIADTYLSPGTIVQRALPRLLETRAVVRDALRDRVIRNFQALQRLCADSALSVLHVEGGWYGVIRLPAVLSEDEWTCRFLAEDGVYVHPGYFYDFERPAFAVVSLIVPPDAFDEGVRRIAARVDAVVR